MTAATAATGVALLQSGSITSRLVAGAAAVFGLALLAAGLAAAVAVIYRWYARERVPDGFPILVGLSGVAAYLNSTTALRQVIGNTGDPLDASVALLNIVTVLVGLFAARVGTEVGDRVGTDVFATSGVREVETEVSRIVQAVGRVITVELPADIDDIVGYDPVPDETKEQLAGRSFVFPRRLTVAELRDRLVTRLKADYAVGHVDMELADDGTVEYLALGSRASGIGPTLPPETSAVAIRADPAFAASAGDLVQVWRTDPMERVLTAELRGKLDDVVTLAVDAADTRRLADDAEYKLVTLPVETRPDREFASILRAADETMAAVTVAEESVLAGQPVGALDVTVVAIRPADGPVEALPARDRRLTAGDSVFLVATPDAIRKVEGSVGPGASATSPGSRMPPDKRVDAATPVTDESVDAESSDPPGAVTRGGTDASRLTETAATQSGDPDETPSTTAGESASDDATDDTLDDDSIPGIQALEPDDTDEPADASDASETVAAETTEATEATEDTGTTESAETDQSEAERGDGGAAVDDTFDLGEPDLSDLDDEDGSADESSSADESGSADEDGGSQTPAEAVGEPDSASDDTDETDAESDAATDDSDEFGLADDGEDSDPLSDWETLDDSEPTSDDLSDLPGTDPDELTGADVDGLSDLGSVGGDETGSGDDTADEDEAGADSEQNDRSRDA